MDEAGERRSPRTGGDELLRVRRLTQLHGTPHDQRDTRYQRGRALHIGDQACLIESDANDASGCAKGEVRNQTSAMVPRTAARLAMRQTGECRTHRAAMHRAKEAGHENADEEAHFNSGLSRAVNTSVP
jgi:hypothetical protein